MRNHFHHHQILFILFVVSITVVNVVETKSSIEPCNSSDSCPSLLSYILPWDSKLSEIATRFNVNVSDILSANSVFPITESSAQQIVSANSWLKIPIRCYCVDGIRRSRSTMYRVEAADTVGSISMGYGGLVSEEQIESENGINGRNNPLRNGGKIVIRLPCACLGNVNNGGSAIYMEYVVQRGENMRSIAKEFRTTVSDLENVNGYGQDALHQGDILSIPIAACSSATLNWYNESLIVPNGSYALTASNCIKCSCQPLDLKMQCVPSGLDIPCYNLRCKGSDLIIGYESVKPSKTACNVTRCLYRGHRGGKILSSIVNSSYLLCPDNRNYSSGATCWPSSSLYPADPSLAMPPSPIPLPVSGAAPRTRVSTARICHFSIHVLQLMFLPKLILYFLM